MCLNFSSQWTCAWRRAFAKTGSDACMRAWFGNVCLSTRFYTNRVYNMHHTQEKKMDVGMVWKRMSTHFYT